MDKDVESIMSIIQNATRLLFLKGLDSNGVHNILEVSYSRAFDEFYVEP